MTKQNFIETIWAIYYKISKDAKAVTSFNCAMMYMSKEDAEILSLIDVNADDKLWKVISNIAQWLNNHAA